MQRFRFIKADLLRVTVPEGKPHVTVADTEVRGLRCRVSALGRMTMFLDCKVAGVHVKKTLGVYQPGPGGNTIDHFRAKARVELGEIADAPARWLEGKAERDGGTMTLADSFDETLKHARRGAMSARDWNESRDRFIAWIKDHYPHVQTWAQLRRLHVREYLESIRPSQANIEAGKVELSPTRKRLLLQPVVQTAGHMWREYEIPNVTERLGLSSKLAKSPAPVYLADVISFLNYLRGNGEPALEAGAALAGLAGLQLLEVLRLRWAHVDLDRALAQIGGDGVAVKNVYRNRVIPIPARCVDALRRAWDVRVVGKVEELDGGAVVTAVTGAPYTKPDGTLKPGWINYSMRLRKAIKAWNPAVSWAPKDLRNALITLGALRGFGGDVLEQYVGHAPRSVSARHYIPRLSAASIGEAAELERQTDIFRRLVVDQVEAEILAVGKPKVQEVKQRKA